MVSRHIRDLLEYRFAFVEPAVSRQEDREIHRPRGVFRRKFPCEAQLTFSRIVVFPLLLNLSLGVMTLRGIYLSHVQGQLFRLLDSPTQHLGRFDVKSEE